jgi:hypothetical protein
VNPSFCALADCAITPESGLHHRLLEDNISLEAAYRALNDAGRYPTPAATIEAILYCVRERGIGALKELKNQERLRQCDEAARAQINRRIAKLCQGAAA